MFCLCFVFKIVHAYCAFFFLLACSLLNPKFLISPNHACNLRSDGMRIKFFIGKSCVRAVPDIARIVHMRAEVLYTYNTSTRVAGRYLMAAITDHSDRFPWFPRLQLVKFRQKPLTSFATIGGNIKLI